MKPIKLIFLATILLSLLFSCGESEEPKNSTNSNNGNNTTPNDNSNNGNSNNGNSNNGNSTNGDITAPTVKSTTPTNGATNVAVTTSIIVNFSEAMNATSITKTGSFTLKDANNNPVGASVEYIANGYQAKLTPNSSLQGETKYTATLSSSITDLAGNSLHATPYSWSFTTADNTFPTVTNIFPQNGAKNVAVNITITATFSEAMNAKTITNSSFTLKQGNQPISGTVTYDANSKTATFSPTSSLKGETDYYVVLTTSITDLAGNPLYKIWNFTTADITAPTVTSTLPTNEKNRISKKSKIIATFSEAMNSTTISNSSFTLKQGNQPISGTVTYDTSYKRATFSPTSSLNRSTTYRATLSNSILDLANHPLNTYSWNVRTSQNVYLSTVYDDKAKAIAIDSTNNIYITGYTEGGLDGNQNKGGNDIFKRKDIFLVKYSANGTKQWTQQLGTASNDEAYGVAIDSTDNIYITGYTQGGLDGNQNKGNKDIFLVKYNSNGTKQWTQQFGTSLSDEAKAIAIDSADNIYLTGTTGARIDKKDYELAQGTDLFLVKYSSNGTKQWTQQLLNIAFEWVTAIAIDSTNNIYITGNVNGSLEGKTYKGNRDVFLVKYSSNGTKQWTQQFGTASLDLAYGLAIDSTDHIYIAVYSGGNFEGTTQNGNSLSSIFLVKCSSDGTKQWAQSLGKYSTDYTRALAIDSIDNIYLTGRSQNKLILIKSNSNGTKQWTQTLGHSVYELGWGIAIDSLDQIYITGENRETHGANEDAFLVKYDGNGNLQ